MAQTVCVVVDDTDQKQLAAIAMDRNRPQKHIQRARIVLLSGEGLAVAEVARQAGVSRPAVWRWQTRYAEAGVAALLRDKRFCRKFPERLSRAARGEWLTSPAHRTGPQGATSLSSAFDLSGSCA
jgi:transposase-like protein